MGLFTKLNYDRDVCNTCLEKEEQHFSNQCVCVSLYYVFAENVFLAVIFYCENINSQPCFLSWEFISASRDKLKC